MIPPRLLQLANVALAALLAYISYDTFLVPRHVVRERKIAGDKEREKPPPEEKRALTKAHYNVIEQANIFKNRDVVPAPPPPPTAVPTPPPPPSPLNLELKGTTTSPRDGRVKALFYNKKTRKTDYYGPGDIIPDTDGAKIVEITRTRVILDRSGYSETLDLYPVDLKPATVGTSAKRL